MSTLSLQTEYTTYTVVHNINLHDIFITTLCIPQWEFPELYLISYAALHPEPVRNLSVTVEEDVTLSWNPPVNIQRAEEVSDYQIRFKPLGSGDYNHKSVKVTDSCATNIDVDFTRHVSSDHYTFEVRARNDCNEGKWEKTSAFCGTLVCMCCHIRYCKG